MHNFGCPTPWEGPIRQIRLMHLEAWLTARGGIAHRSAADQAGFTPHAIRREVAAGRVLRVRRSWIALELADPDLVAAARAGGRVSCVTAARRRGWWMPRPGEPGIHLHLPPHATSPDLGSSFDGVVHWTVPLAPAPPHDLLDSVEDTLEQVARCLDTESALVVWESAVRSEGLAVEAMRRVLWKSRRATDLSQRVTGLSDSGLETIFVTRISAWGVRIRQQIVLADRPTDVLLGEWLVVQLDGFAFHSTAAQRSRDAAHDAELMLRGYTVLRFTYAQVMHDWPAVERTIARALAAGAHLSPR